MTFEILKRESEILRRALTHHGWERQVRQLGEECSELAAATNRVFRPDRTMPVHQLMSEIADVEIMLAQVKAGLATALASSEHVPTESDVRDALDVYRASKLRQIEVFLNGVGAAG